MHPFSTDPGWYVRHWYGLHPGRTFEPSAARKPGSGQGLPALSTVTLGLAAYFIAASAMAALLALRYGLLETALAP